MDARDVDTSNDLLKMKSKPVLEIKKYSSHIKEDMASDVTTPKVLLTQQKLKEFNTLANNGTPSDHPRKLVYLNKKDRQADEQMLSFPIQNKFMLSFNLILFI